MSDTLADARADASVAVETAIAHLYQAAKARMRSLAIAFHPDLQPIGYGILRFVFENEPARASDVAAELGMDKSAVSRQVAGLKDMGLIETREDPADGRATLLVASRSSRSALDAFHAESASDFARIFTGWSTRDVCDFARLLAQFNGSIR